MRPLPLVLAVVLLIALGAPDSILCQPDPPLRIHFDSFQLDRRYADIALVGAVSLNSTFYIQGDTIDSPRFLKKYSTESQICSPERCYSIPLLTQILDGTAWLFCPNQYGGFKAPARLFPLYPDQINSTHHTKDTMATIDEVLRRQGAQISSKPSRQDLMAVVFAPSADQNFTLLAQGKMIFMQFSAQETNASITIESNERLPFLIDLKRCSLRILTNQITLDAPDGEGIDYSGDILYPDVVKCDFAEFQDISEKMHSSMLKVASSTRRQDINRNYEDVLSALSHHQWTYCNWMAESLVVYNQVNSSVLSTTKCFERPGSPEFEADPCCNQAYVTLGPCAAGILDLLCLLWKQCCKYRNQTVELPEWQGWHHMGISEATKMPFFVTSPQCKTTVLSELTPNVVLDEVTTRPSRIMTALNDYALWKRRAIDPSRGCEGVPFISDHVFEAVRAFYASCLDTIYGVPTGQPQKCFNDEDCPFGIDCNEVTLRCAIPWKSPEIPLARCLLERKQPYVFQYFLFLLELPQNATELELAAALASYETTADCAGPTAPLFSGQMSCYGDIENRPDECRASFNASGCLSEQTCNWHSCPESNLEGRSCRELCEDLRIPGQSVCGWCSEGDFGRCYSVSEAPGCLAPNALSRAECDLYAAENSVQTFWEPLDRLCFITSVHNKEDCLMNSIACPAQASPSLLSSHAVFKTLIRNQEMDIIDISNIEISSATAPGSQFVGDVNWNRTVCPQTCFDSKRAQQDCKDENCDHQCCNREQTCLDPDVRACVCSIDAFCCDNWDDHCNRKAIDDGCVNCNCIRRRWDPLLNYGQGLCKIMLSSQEFCEDPWRGNATWFAGRVWRAGRFATQDRCSEGACDTNLSVSGQDQCNATVACEGPLCARCTTTLGSQSAGYAEAEKLCSSLSETQCQRCIYGVSTCEINQTMAMCVLRETPCEDQPTCEARGKCSDEEYLVSDSYFGRCVLEVVQTENSTATCPEAAVPLEMTPIGCIAPTINDPKDCHIKATQTSSDPRWREPQLDRLSCILQYPPKCLQPLEKLGFGMTRYVETWYKTCSNCKACGGECEQSTRWISGKWRGGRMLPMRWMPRAFEPINRGIQTMNHTLVKAVLEHAIEMRLRDSLASDLMCRYSGLTQTIYKIGDICTKKEVQQRSDSGLKHPVVLAQRSVFWNASESIDIAPITIEIEPGAVQAETVRVDVRVTLFSMMDAYVNGTSPAKRDMAIDVVRVQPSGYLIGQLIGDGVRVEIFDSLHDNKPLRLRSGTARLCMDVRNHPDLKWRQIFPVPDLATVSTVIPPDGTTQHVEAFVPLLLESTRNLSVFPGLFYEYNSETGEFTRMCISLNSSGIWYPSTRMSAIVTITSWLPYVAIAVFAVIFALAGRKFFWMIFYDRTKHRLMKPITGFGAAIVAASRVVLMIIVIKTRWQRAYPEDFVVWNGFDWTAKLFLVLAVEMYVVTVDTPARAGYCGHPVRLWWMSVPAQLGLATVFFVGFVMQFPLPDWSQDALEQFYHMEYLFNYSIAGTALAAIFFLAIFVLIKARSRRGRILVAIPSAITLAYFARIVVWTYFDTFFGNLDKFWLHVAEMMLFEAVLCLFIVFFHDAHERLDSDDDEVTFKASINLDAAVELDNALDDGSLPTREGALTDMDIDELTSQGDLVASQTEKLLSRMDRIMQKLGANTLGDEVDIMAPPSTKSSVQLLEDEDYTLNEVFDSIDWNLRQIVGSGRQFEAATLAALEKRGIKPGAAPSGDAQFARNMANAVRELKEQKEAARKPNRASTMQIVERNLSDLPADDDGGDIDEPIYVPKRRKAEQMPPPRASRVLGPKSDSDRAPLLQNEQQQPGEEEEAEEAFSRLKSALAHPGTGAASSSSSSRVAFDESGL